MIKFLKNTTNEDISNFHRVYDKDHYKPMVIQPEIEGGIQEDKIGQAINSSIEDLDLINNLAETVLNDMRPVLKKYNAWLTSLQIITVISSGGVISFISLNEKTISLIIAILALLTSVGGLIAKSLITPLFGGGIDRQVMANRLIDLRGKSVALKVRLNTIKSLQGTIEQIRTLIEDASSLIGEMEALLSGLKGKKSI